jgi:hypothetical protein
MLLCLAELTLEEDARTGLPAGAPGQPRLQMLPATAAAALGLCHAALQYTSKQLQQLPAGAEPRGAAIDVLFQTALSLATMVVHYVRAGRATMIRPPAVYPAGCASGLWRSCRTPGTSLP